jgi:hypothetical protein
VDRLTDRDKLTARDRSGDAQGLDIQQSFGRTSSDVAPGRFTRLYCAWRSQYNIPLDHSAGADQGSVLGTRQGGSRDPARVRSATPRMFSGRI